MNKSYLFLSVALSSALFANTNDRLRDNIITTSNDGRQNVQKNEGILLKRERSVYNFDKEVMLNWAYKRKGVQFATLDVNESKIKVRKNPIVKDDKNEDDIIKTVNVKGYCIIEEETNIGLQPMSANFNCNTNLGTISFSGNYVPYPKLETLFVSALHIEKNNRKYKVMSGRVLSGDKSSYNVATYVNNRKLAKLGYDSLSSTSETVNSGVNDYMDALEASKTKETASLGSGGSSNSGSGNVINEPVKLTNTEKPDAADYIVKGVVGIVTGIASNISKIYNKDLPYLYQIVPKSKVYIDLYVDEEEMKNDSTIFNDVSKKHYSTTTKNKK